MYGRTIFFTIPLDSIAVRMKCGENTIMLRKVPPLELKLGLTKRIIK